MDYLIFLSYEYFAIISNDKSISQLYISWFLVFLSQACELQTDDDDIWTHIWDDEQKAPYLVRGEKWISFENKKSVGMKVSYGALL